MNPDVLLEVRNLKRYFPVRGGLLQRKVATVQAVDDISFSVRRGETLGIVGESGCGKSTTARLLIQLLAADAGTIAFAGRTVGTSGGMGVRDLRRQVQMVFQDSYSSLNPRCTIEDTIAYGPSVHGVGWEAARQRAREILTSVGLDPALFAARYPHELSGGQRQRVNIARALALEPKLVVLDEAVSALDKSVEAQVLNLLVELKRELALTYIFISHDLNVVRYMSDRVLVMYLGKVVEVGPVESIYGSPRHPYTRALLGAMPSMDPDRRGEQATLTGDPPSPINPPPGCRFHTRCAHAEACCAAVEPPLAADGDHHAACHMLISGSGHSAAPRREESMMAKPAATRRPAAATSREAEPLVRCEDLVVRFVGREGPIHAVNGVSFTLDAGEVLGILGESGSGKSVTLRAMMRLLPAHIARISGRVSVAGRNVMGLDWPALSDLRGAEVGMIFQEPMTSFDPVFTIGAQIIETLKRHDGLSERHARQRALELFETVQIPSPARRLDNYPHEMSGGMRQRAMIALALACKPRLLLADEPTTALDATVQIQILQLLRRLQRELRMAVLFVTHDVGVAVEISDRIAVMYAGRFVETGPVRAIIHEPQHPYTRGLLASTVHGTMRGHHLEAIPGSPPNLAALPPGCAFAPRCRHVEPGCTTAVPSEVWHGDTRMVRCTRATPRLTW